MDPNEFDLQNEFSSQKLDLLSILLEEQGLETSDPKILSGHSRQGEQIPLSFSQQRLWFLDQLGVDGFAYHLACGFQLAGQLDIPVLIKCLNKLVARHASLRTTFGAVYGKPYQKISAAQELDIQFADLSSLEETDKQNRFKTLIASELQTPFDLKAGHLFRTRLWKFSEVDYILVFIMHHIISDEWSLNIVFEELSVLYPALLAGKNPPLPENKFEYADYINWQERRLQSPAYAGQIGYWKNQLAGDLPAMHLPFDRLRPAIQTFRGALQRFSLPSALLTRLKELSREEDSTLFMTLLAAFKTLLYRYTGQTDLVVGVPIANRTQLEFEKLVGFLVNSLVLRTNISGLFTFRQFLQKVRTVTLAAYSNQDVPFEKLVQELRPERDLNHNPLFQIMFSYQNLSRSELNLGEVSVLPLALDYSFSKFDLTLFIEESVVGLSGVVEYNTDLFNPATIMRLVDHFQSLLQGIASNPDEKILNLPILTTSELYQLVTEWNDTAFPLPAASNVVILFEEQVERNPGALAVVSEDQHLTYQELNECANQLAGYLRQLGIGPDRLVGICMPRSLELMVAFLGVLKAGGAYVPLDPGYPKERLAFMVADSAIPVILTLETLKPLFPDGAVHLICLDSELEMFANQERGNLTCVVTPENLAYMIFTSGSTGKPKGAMIHHHGLLNYLTWCRQNYPVDGIGAPVHSSISFDLTITSIFPPLISGKTVYMLSEGPGIEPLRNAMLSINGFSLVKITPTHLELLKQTLQPNQLPGQTHAFIIGGENLLMETISFWHKNAPQTRLINEYGPTETVVGCCVYEVPAGDSRTGSVPIGRPIINTQLYVLDAAWCPVPIGIVGELYIGGAGPGRGYHQRPGMTAERFIPDPFSGQRGSRLYRTGDLARWRADGILEFLGRTDDQVKIRGYRVELGEIEAAISHYQGVRECFVISHQSSPSESLLVAYLVQETNARVNAIHLKQYLKITLPEYMVPANFIFLETLPLNSNGKIDRKALPVPDLRSREVEGTYLPPQDPVQQIIAAIWQEALRMEKVGIQDNFFELGGHSLLLVQVHSRLIEHFPNLAVVDLFRYPTISALAQYLSHQNTSKPGVVKAQERAALQKTAIEQQRQRSLARRAKNGG